MVEHHDRVNHRQSKPNSRTTIRCGSAIKAFIHDGLFAPRNSTAAVGNLKDDTLFRSGKFQRDPSAFRRVLEGIVK